MLATGSADHDRDIRRDPVRAMVRGPASILQPLAARFVEPLEPFVARLPTDVIPRAEPRHRVEPDAVIADEPLSLLHG